MPAYTKNAACEYSAERQPEHQHRPAPPPAEPRRTAADERQAGAEHAGQRVRVAAVAERAEVAGREEAREAGGDDARLAILVAKIPPDEHRHGEEQHGVEHVIAEPIAEQRHRHERQRRRSSGRCPSRSDSRRGTTSSIRRRRRAAAGATPLTACWKSGVQSSLNGICDPGGRRQRDRSAVTMTPTPASSRASGADCPMDTARPTYRGLRSSGQR